MCLAIPAKLIMLHDSGPAGPQDTPILTGQVELNGAALEVSLILTPQAVAGDYLLVHAGHALEVIQESDAREIWDYFRQAGYQPGEILDQDMPGPQA